MDSPGKNTGVGSHSLPQGIFPTQRSNPCLLHCRQILYQLSHQGSPIFYSIQNDPILNEFSPFNLVKNLWAIQETLISGGLSMQWLETGLEFPARDWTGSWRWKDQILAIRPVVKDKGSGPSALKKIISTKMESSEASKEFFRRKKSTLHVDIHTGRLWGRVPELLSHVLMAVWIIFLGHFFWFSFG